MLDIESAVRTQLWGATPKRHHGLHLLGGWFLTDEPIGTRGVFAHDRTTQGSYTPIRHEGRDGYEWWAGETHTHRRSPRPSKDSKTRSRHA
ncbi:hypothetical protein [Microbacterium foliorum]|uniref:hypothetical protein n=1 Tax=Microbacterium foliorum TaxID=104336 RepID=UPI00373576DA